MLTLPTIRKDAVKSSGGMGDSWLTSYRACVVFEHSPFVPHGPCEQLHVPVCGIGNILDPTHSVSPRLALQPNIAGAEDQHRDSAQQASPVHGVAANAA